ncbi:hypothetical protein NM688_g5406 [Phlebia brevispora]|uniref:Uncharacterized protein n=1 Tax=Phlebia brevispora TaxID=194682 RepID=A0ACC1SVQ7_9APHY|nr:hypothetical protein NM688_g5406 [Phlebia brevispora]
MPDITNLAEVALLGQTQLICTYAAIALVWYDYALTFSDEVREIWGRKLSWISALYHVNRYSLIACSVILFIMQFNWWALTNSLTGVSHSCAHFLTADKILNVLTGLCAAAFNALRVYALYGKARWIFVATLTLGAAAPIITAVGGKQVHGITPQLTASTCFQYVWAVTMPWLGFVIGVGRVCGVAPLVQTILTQDSLLLASRVSALSADSVVLALTLAEGYKTWKMCGGLGMSMTLKLMLQEGVLYYRDGSEQDSLPFRRGPDVALCLDIDSDNPLHIGLAHDIQFIAPGTKHYLLRPSISDI